ncbi:MAG: hypothetical protein COU07_03060 [Candidatus Harrisonbacteria bacterium CG10_big_fil_rev_8_21_14_0_10_40_38]|uniref:Uncharacterized protein n=1 Tax=Candidatus Harrisonbacteria bacterium CG10_big_fil_rev_8_21_14_0_10_40_38 TaxID=1974583 RepID=A0A2H0UTR6_9BACT|nr:MAG: hypothetical protein COU07_03060 [Candidatus Harrisonbacteria bacterium CG10_big_fil_rev_8_21_14_0_10_40_38]
MARTIFFLKQFLLRNTSTGQTVTKNTFWLFFGQILSRLFRATIVIYAARKLGADSWGAFSHALGIATFLTIVTDIGINGLITRQTSKNPALRDEYISTGFFIKIFLISVALIALIILFPHVTNIPEAKTLIPILIFVFAFDTIRDLGNALIRSLEKMELEALITVFTNLIIAVLGFVLLAYSNTSMSLALAYAIGSLLGMIIAIFSLRRHIKNIFIHFKPSLIKPILQTAWPFGLLGIMGIVTLNTDIIMIGWLRSPSEVGYYSAAQKLIQLLYVFPTLIGISIFPAVSRLLATIPAIAKKILEYALSFVFVFSVVFVVIGFVAAPEIISLFFGSSYFAAVLPFQILIFTLLSVYPSSILSQAIFAYGYEKRFLPVVLWTIFGNAFFNILLIPKFGIEGAAFATIAVQIITSSYLWYTIYKVTGLSIKSSFLSLFDFFARYKKSKSVGGF